MAIYPAPLWFAYVPGTSEAIFPCTLYVTKSQQFRRPSPSYRDGWSPKIDSYYKYHRSSFSAVYFSNYDGKPPGNKKLRYVNSEQKIGDLKRY